MKKVIFTIVIIILLAIAYIAYADATSATYPGTGADDSATGTVAWVNPTRITASDSSDSTVSLSVTTKQPGERDIQLVKGGTISGNNKASDNDSGQIGSDRGFVSYGSSSDLWGLTLTPTDINASNFGAVFCVRTNWDVPLSSNISHFLKGTNFGFSIPSTATINGILLEVDENGNNGFPTAVVSVDSMRITVTYTLASATFSQTRLISGQMIIKTQTIMQ